MDLRWILRLGETESCFATILKCWQKLWPEALARVETSRAPCQMSGNGNMGTSRARPQVVDFLCERLGIEAPARGPSLPHMEPCTVHMPNHAKPWKTVRGLRAGSERVPRK